MSETLAGIEPLLVFGNDQRVRGKLGTLQSLKRLAVCVSQAIRRIEKYKIRTQAPLCKMRNSVQDILLKKFSSFNDLQRCNVAPDYLCRPSRLLNEVHHRSSTAQGLDPHCARSGEEIDPC